ncbi:MAG: hypothetical protein E7370_03415 [Clostridiales bacterium]|nr:hypothetical protein [Clostridiales bacterium]
MEQLIKSTTAYNAFCADKASGKLSHAYMLHFPDEFNLKSALKLFAEKVFEGNSRAISLIKSESFTDCRFYPEEGKKIAVDGISQIIEDTALKPLEGDIKLYVICGFEKASAIVQNKLLKVLEEPPKGVHFLLGATTLAPVLDTVKSRVKALVIPPFTKEQIYSVLLKKYPQEEGNLYSAAEASGGILGVAENMVKGEWFKKVREYALNICTSTTPEKVARAIQDVGDTKYKTELLGEMQRLYFTALCAHAGEPCEGDAMQVYKKWKKPTLIFAVENIVRAAADVRFNAYFLGLLYDFALKVIKENEKWKK